MTDTTQNIQKQLRGKDGKLVANRATPTLAILDAVDTVVKSIRARFPEVPPIVLVVGASGKRARSMVHGHFAPDRWESKNGAHEILLSGESLRRGAEPTLGTILHEVAHALAASREIKDTSRGARYHNKAFKKLAEEVGIVVEYSKQLGWSETTVPPETAKLYKSELAVLRKALKAYRRPEPENAKKPSKNMRVECGCRAVTVPIKFYDKGTFTCDECDEVFLPVESIDEDEEPEDGPAIKEVDAS
jgi:hypothetical protein